MLEVYLGLVILIVVLFGIAFNFMTWREVTRTIEHNAEKVGTFDFDKIAETVGDEIESIIENAMSNFSLPTAQDHLFGMISQFVQSKMMRDLHKDGLLNSNMQTDDSGDYGEA